MAPSRRSHALCPLAGWLLWAVPCFASSAPSFEHHARRVSDLLAAAPLKLRRSAAARGAEPGRPGRPAAAARSAGLRLRPADFGADPHGVKDSTLALQAAVDTCVNRSKANDQGFFPGLEDHWGPIRDAGGCLVDLDGGEYRLSAPLAIPELVANMQLGHGSLVADPEHFPQHGFLLTVGTPGSCKVPQGSCNIDLNFPELFFDGSKVANALQINNVMGTTVGPGGYFLNFTRYGLQINGGHEVMMDRCWLGETNFDYRFADHKTAPNATAIEINGNDHYILNTIVFSSKIGVQVNGAADVITGVHVWFPINRALDFKDVIAFHVPYSGNRFTGCYIDGSRAVFEGDGLKNNIWTGGFECCAGGGLGDVPHGVMLRGDTIGPGLQIFSNLFNGGSIWHEPSSPGKVPTVRGSHVDSNSFGGSAKSTRASKTLSQTSATQWKFDFCDSLVFPVIASVQVSLQTTTGFPQYAIRPPSGCTVLVETSAAVTGSMTVSVDSSTPGDGQGLEVSHQTASLAFV